ncbi:MAG: hypothetical protein LBH91_02970 [Prevotellaceae bacterium]|jgi:hypothetical protein|nr:hypothetical protein [Prevotellaceae bacterium]
MKRINILCLLLFAGYILSAQNIAATDGTSPVTPKFLYKFDNLTYFDNRAFSSPYNSSVTFFGDRLTALLGYGIKDRVELYAGVTAMMPFGKDYNDYKYQPMAYLKYQQNFNTGKDNPYVDKINLYFGILPYRKIKMVLPGFIRKGSIEYSVPNLQGALAQYELNICDIKKKLLLEYVVDWRKIATATERDCFGMILGGKYSIYSNHFDYENFLSEKDGYADFGFIVQWDRLGNNLDTIKNYCDNIVMNVFAKIDFAQLYWNNDKADNRNLNKDFNIKTLFLQAGYLGNFSNDNLTINNQWCHSIVVDCGIQWKIIALKNSFYVSLNKDGNLMLLYKDYPSMFIADQYYQASLYNKTELSFDLIKSSFFSLKAQFLAHYVPDYKVGWQQKITASVKF